MMMPRRLNCLWGGRCSPRRGALFFLGLVASTDPAAIAAIAAAPAATTTPNEAAAAAA